LDVYQATKAIQQAGFGPQDEFSIPEPLAYLPSLRLLLQEKVEGPVAKEVFKRGDERIRAAAAERCALWLARFHALAPKAGPVSRPSDYVTSKTMRRYSLKIAKLVGRHAEKAAQLLHRLKDASASLSAVDMCAGHASYTPRQVILAEGRTVVFDWDGFDVADPARDVARFLAALRRLALGWLGSVRAMDGAVEVFLKTYLAAGPREATKNLRFFAAATYLNLAKHTLCRPGPYQPEKQEIAEAVLDEGLRVLEPEATP
jgi:aminoglycoside phosphotransferase (APT) family kinase protein